MIRVLCAVYCSAFLPIAFLNAVEAETSPHADDRRELSDAEAKSIPFDQLGEAVQKQLPSESSAVRPTADGAQLQATMQDLEANATSTGLWLSSTADEDQGKANRFRVRAMAVGRGRPSTTGDPTLTHGDPLLVLPETGTVSAVKDGALWSRFGLMEEYSASADGIRQDFVVTRRPSGDGQLCVELEITGAHTEITTSGDATLTLEATGREIAFTRLHVMDATGKKLSARFKKSASHRLGILVEDAGATYPVRIDPTFSDADWSSMGTPSGVSGAVYAMVTDAEGNLIVGGSFTSVGDLAARSIAKWNGSEWQALGLGVNGTVKAMAVSGGDLYVGGLFSTAGGVTALHIAKWNGTAWEPVGSGITEVTSLPPSTAPVNALAVSGSDLYVAGTFTRVGNVPANRIARWNGSTWAPLGSGLNHEVRTLAFLGSDLYAGGFFSSAGSTPASCIARWNGSTWSALGTGISGTAVYALATHNGNLIIGGQFYSAGGWYSPGVALWTGSSWSAMETGAINGLETGAVHTFLQSGGELYMGGLFSPLGGSDGVAKWNGTSWDSIDYNFDTGIQSEVYALSLHNGQLYAGGIFSEIKVSVSPYTKPANGLAKWTESSGWSNVVTGTGLNSSVSALAVSGNDLYVGGSFIAAGSTPLSRIAKWNGNSWSALGSGLGGPVHSLLVSGGNVYAGGNFSGRLRRWNGSTWTTLGSGIIGNTVSALVMWNGDLYAGGDFWTAGGASVDNIAKWNGSTWSPLGNGLQRDGMYAEVSALAIFENALYAGGYFTSAGGSPANHVARWDGNTWSALGSGVSSDFSSNVRSLAVWRNELYVGGYFTTAGTVQARNIAKWDGTAWSAVSSPFIGTVYPLLAHNEHLYAGGPFSTSGSFPISGLARWNGQTWSGFGSGVSSASALAVVGNHLYVGGPFFTAGGKTSPGLARCELTALTVSLANATAITAYGATLNGIINPRGQATTAQFEYGLDSSYGSSTMVVLSPNNDFTDQSVSTSVSGLSPSTLYHYRLTTSSASGAYATRSGTFTTLSTDANLAGLALSSGSLSPIFSSDTTSYDVTVANEMASVTVTPIASHSNATVTVNGSPVTSGGASNLIPLSLGGGNVISIVVTAQDGVTVKAYTIHVTRYSGGFISIGHPANSIINVYEEAGEILIPIVRSSGTNGVIGFSASTTEASATLGTDYHNPASPLSMGDGVTSMSFAIPIVNTPATGEPNETFTVRISDATGGATLGSVTSVTVRIIDSTDAVLPTAPVIASPAANAVFNLPSGTSFNITGTASDNRGVARVEIKLNNGDFQPVTTLNSPGEPASGWTHVLQPVNGANTVSVRSIDTRGNVSPLATRTFKVQREVKVEIAGSGSVTSGLAGSFREADKSLTITATPAASPAPGSIFTGWSVTWAGSTPTPPSVPATREESAARIGVAVSALEKPSLTFIFREGVTLTATFAANPFWSLAGVYNGLIQTDSSQDSVLPNSTEGFFTATVQNTGAFTGKLTIDGFVLNAAGSFDSSGVARFGTARQTALTVPRTNKPSLSVTLQASLQAPYVITGTVTQTGFKRSDVLAESSITADRAFFGSQILPGAITASSPYITMASTAGRTVGETAAGAGIPAGTTIISIESATVVELSRNATATNPGASLTFTRDVDADYLGTGGASGSLTSILPPKPPFYSRMGIFDSTADTFNPGAATEFHDGDPVRFRSHGSLPLELSEADTYFVTNKSDNLFQIEDAASNTINFAAGGSGEIVLDPANRQTRGYEASDYPQGYGYGTFTVSKNGTVTLSGVLADGTAVTSSSTLSQPAPHSRLAVYASLYSGKGFISGYITPNKDDLLSDMSGINLKWARPEGTNSHYYPAGWPHGLTLDLLAAKYNAVGNVLKRADDNDAGLIGNELLSADLANGNAALSFEGGQLSESLMKLVSVTSNMATKVPANDPTFTLSITGTSGALTGTVYHTNDTAPSFRGIIYQKGTISGGYGYFLTTQPAIIDYTGESGSFSLIGNP